MGKASSLIALLALFALGCNGSGSSLSGTVTYEGEPVETGSITFTSASGSGNPFGGEITNGKYAIKDASPGAKTVNIVGGDLVMITRDSGDAPENPLQIPPNAVGNKSQVEVKSGSQTLDFNLTAP